MNILPKGFRQLRMGEKLPNTYYYSKRLDLKEGLRSLSSFNCVNIFRPDTHRINKSDKEHYLIIARK